jgi:hypothetical protein
MVRKKVALLIFLEKSSVNPISGLLKKFFGGGRSQESGVRSQEFQALLPLFFVPSYVLQEG